MLLIHCYGGNWKYLNFASACLLCYSLSFYFLFFPSTSSWQLLRVFFCLSTIWPHSFCTRLIFVFMLLLSRFLFPCHLCGFSKASPQGHQIFQPWDRAVTDTPTAKTFQAGPGGWQQVTRGDAVRGTLVWTSRRRRAFHPRSDLTIPFHVMHHEPLCHELVSIMQMFAPDSISHLEK